MNGNLLQYSCLENPPDRGAWRAAVHGVIKSWTQLSAVQQFQGRTRCVFDGCFLVGKITYMTSQTRMEPFIRLL